MRKHDEIMETSLFLTVSSEITFTGSSGISWELKFNDFKLKLV